jgi:hypothetical protein
MSNQLTDATLRKIASTVARVCLEWGIPIRKVTPGELAAGVKGICGHLDVTNAWGQGDHTDPGVGFPWATFISYVDAAANPTPAPLVEEDDMFALALEIPHKVPVTTTDTSGAETTTYEWPEQWPEGIASYTIPTVNSGTVPWGAAWVSMCNDTFGEQYAVRVAGGNGSAKVYANPQVLNSLVRWYAALDNNTACISLVRQPAGPDDKMTAVVTALVEYARR